VEIPLTLDDIDGDFDNVDRKATARGLLVFQLHVGARIAHGPDDPIERDKMAAITTECHACGVNCLDRSNGVALDAWHLDKATDRMPP